MIKRSSGQAAGARSDTSRSLGEEVREYYRTVLRQLPWLGSGSSDSLRTLGITSCYSGEGVSTVAAQLAVTAAASGDRPVLLVDCNLARPSVEQTFKVDPTPGLAEALLDNGQIAAGIQPSPVANLSVLPAGKPNGSLAQAYDSAVLSQVIEVHRFKPCGAL